MTSIVNLQKEVRLDTKPFRQLIDLFHDSVTEAVNKEFTVAFVSNRRMIELNKIFRCKDSITDVLSFPSETDGTIMQSSPSFQFTGVATL